MKLVIQGILLYFMIVALIGIFLFGVLLMTLMMDYKFSKLNIKKLEQCEGVWLMLLSFSLKSLSFYIFLEKTMFEIRFGF